MADVQLFDFGYRRDRPDVANGEAMAGMHCQSKVSSASRRISQRLDGLLRIGTWE